MRQTFVLACAAVFWAAPRPPALAATVWVSNERSGSLTVIDSATDRVVSTVAVGGRPRGIQVAPDDRTVYVAVSHPAKIRSGPPHEIVAVDAATRRVRGSGDRG